jgi:hypothetical protein
VSRDEEAAGLDLGELAEAAYDTSDDEVALAD